MNEPIKGQRLTNRQSLDMLTQDHDIPVISPLRIKLEPAGPVDETWLRGVHVTVDGTVRRVLVIPSWDAVGFTDSCV